MKKYNLLLTFIFACFTFFLQAQDRNEHHDKIKAYKVAYITEKLDLSESEAQKFWPIYNDFSEKMMELHREERFKIKKRISDLGGIEKLSESEAKEILDKINSVEKQRIELKTTFSKKIVKFLSYKKMLTLEVAEHEFNRKLLRKLRDPKRRDH